MAAERVVIIGPPGSGKTTLAGLLGERLKLPVFNLDDVARVGGGRGAETTSKQRAQAIEGILGQERWLAEGVHLGWTQPLLAAADVIIWLDHVRWRRSGGRIVRRFAHQAWAEARRRRGRERFLRWRDYGRRLRELAVSVPEARTFDDAALERAIDQADGAARLIRCRTEEDVAALPERLGGTAGP